MKNKNNYARILGATALIAGLAVGPAVVTTARAGETATTRPVGLFSSKKEITGRVSAKTDGSLTVGTTLLSVSSSTTITKGGQAIKLSDIAVGDPVRVTASPGENNVLQALSIEVMAGAGGPAS